MHICTRLMIWALTCAVVWPALAAPAIGQERDYREPGPVPAQLDRVLELLPAKANTSGMRTAGSALAVAFLDAPGDYVAVAGNDDRVHVASVGKGRRLWRSGALKKDVVSVAVCDDPGRLLALNYDGRAFVFPFERWDRPPAKAQAMALAPGIAAFVGSCDHVGITGILAGAQLFDVGNGRALSDGIGGVLPRSFDPRGFQYSRFGILRFSESEPRKAEVMALSPGGDALALEASLALPAEELGKNWVQLWRPTRDWVVAEQCGESECALWILDARRGDVRHTLRRNTGGAVWVASVPSTVEMSDDGRWLFWHRDGLTAELWDLSSGTMVQSFGLIPRAMAGCLDAAFSRNGQRLAITMKPKPNAVSIYRLLRE